MERKKFNQDSKSDSLNKNKCFLCEKIIRNNNNKTQLITKNHSLDNLNQNLKIYDPNFYFNQTEIENLLYLNSSSGNELISPCSCERRFHKNCILLYALYSNSIRCESCLDLYSIRCPEKYNTCSLFLSENYLFTYLLYFILIFLTTVAILIIASSKTLVPEIYSEMKIFFILILILLNIAIIIALVLECFNMKRSKPPISIYIEDKSIQMQNENEGSNPNKAAINHSENQNSNQNLITNNLNNAAALSNLNKINTKLFPKNNSNSNNNYNNPNSYKPQKSNGGVSQTSHLEYSKNFIHYNEFCLNILRIEIFESKLNFISRNKLILEKHLEHLNTIRELNDDEFQQQILIKCMDFNSSESDIDVHSVQERKKKFMQQLRSNNNLNSNYNNNNSNNALNKNSSSKLAVFAKAKKSEKKIVLRKNSFEELEELEEQDNRRFNRNFYKNFNEHESENEYAYCKNLNGIIPDVLRNNNNKIYTKHKTYDRQNSETNNPNTENFNTNINSVSGVVRNLASNKELNLSNIKQENQMDFKSNSINNSGNLINYSPKNLNNNSGEKLILKENNFSGISLVKKTSNPVLNRYNTLSKFSRNHSNNEVNNFDSHGSSNKFGKLENEVVDYRDFIVTEEKEIGGNNKLVQPRPRQSAKNRLVRRDSKIPSAFFGDLRELKHKNINSGLNQSIHNNSPKNDPDGNHSPKNSQNKIPAKKIMRRYSSFNPQIVNNLSFAAGQNPISNSKKAFGSSNKAGLGMNIFSNNVINTYSLENNFKAQGRTNTSEGYEFGKIMRKGTNEFNRKLSSNQFIESDSILKAMNNDANKEGLQMNSGNQANTRHYSPNIDNINNNKEILKDKNIRNSIEFDTGLNDPKNTNCNYENYDNNNTTNAKDLNMFSDIQGLSVSPPRFQKKPSKESGLRNSTNIDPTNAENEVLTQKLNKLRNNSISISHVGFNINLINKLVLENSRRNSMESFERSSAPLKGSGSPRNNSMNNPSFAANYIAINPLKKIITEDKSLRRASYLMENQLVTIKEDIETPQAPKRKALNEILEINSEFNDEFVYEKNKILSSEEFASNAPYANYYNNSNNFTPSNNVDKSLNRNNFGESYNYNDLNDLNNNNNNNSFNNDVKSANNRVGVSAYYQSTSNNFKHITNHLMENIEEIIREDKSDTLSEDSVASSKSNSTGNNLKTDKKRKLTLKENEHAKNLKSSELEIKESLKSPKKMKPVKNSNIDDQENVVRRINSIVSAKKRTNEFFIEDFDKSESNDFKVFKKANSCFDDSNNIKSLKILSNNNTNDNNKDTKPFADIKPANLNSKTIDSNEEKEIKFSNKDQKAATIGTSNRSNVYISNNNLDSLVISESNEEFKSLDSRKNPKNLDSNSIHNVVDDAQPLNLINNNKNNHKNNCEEIKDKSNQVDHLDIIDNSVDRRVNKDPYNKSKEVKKINEVKSKHIKTDELDIENLIDNNNSSEDESDSNS